MTSEQDYRAILMINEPFHKLIFSKYLDRAKKKKLFKGEEIRFKTRSIDDAYFYYVEEGQIAAKFTDETGEGVALFYRNPGNAFSAESYDYASIGKYGAKFVATKNSVLYCLSQRELYELAMEDPQVFYEFVKVCHMAFAQLGHRISGTGTLPAVERATMWLQKLCSITKPNPDGTYSIECSLTLEQLAKQLLIHITTCTKIIAKLEEDGVIKRTRHRIEVYKPDALACYSLEDADRAY